MELIKVDREASLAGEFGIGLNPKARLTGNLLEDEKAGRTLHIAFGNNMDMPEGRTTARRTGTSCSRRRASSPTPAKCS